RRRHDDLPPVGLYPRAASEGAEEDAGAGQAGHRRVRGDDRHARSAGRRRGRRGGREPRLRRQLEDRRMSQPRDTAGVIAPPPLIFLGFLVVGWAIGRWTPVPGLGLDPDARKWLAVGLIALGLVVEMWAAGQFRK